MEIINLKNIHKKYNEGKQNEVHALQGVNLTINKGDSIAIMGVSGSGKSTLLNIIGCLDNFTDGEYFLNGENITSKNATQLAEIRNSVFGFILQSYGLIESDKVFNNIQVPLLFSKKYKSKEQKDRINTILYRLKITELKNKKVRDLSGGQKQRVAIAGILAIKPRIIVFDESTAMLDPQGRKEVLEVAKQLNKEENITIIWITHYMDEAVDADRVAIMNDARIVAIDTPQNIFRRTDLIESAGLDLPLPLAIANSLREIGLPLEGDILTEKALEEELCKTLK